MPKASFGFAVGNLRAREVTLLKSTDIEQLLGMEGTTAMTAFLRDKGFFTGSDPDGDIFDMLEAETGRLWEYLLSIVPEKKVFNAFLYLNDFHNIKVILKGTAKDRDYSALLKQPSTVDVQDIKTAVTEKRFDLLEGKMRTATEAAYSAIFKDGDARLCDALLDAACMDQQLKAARQAKIPLLEKIITASVFYANVKVALRCAAAGLSADFLEKALTDTGVIDKKDLITAALSGTDSLLERLEGADRLDSSAAAAAYREGPAEFERFTDNYILGLARGAKYITVGGEVAVGYLIAKLREIAAVRIVASGKKTGQSEAQIRGRLRELYG